MSDLSGFMTGFSNGLNDYLKMNNQNKATQANELYKNQLEEQSKLKEQAANQKNELEKGKALEQNKLDLAGKVTPEMAGGLFGSISPEFGQAAQKYAADFKTKNGRDLTTEETKSGLLDLVGKMGGPSKKAADEAFNKAKNAVTSSRGDPALTEIQKQQNAVGLGYRTLVDARAGKIALSPAVWNDVMGQLWKGRTGGVPPEQVMKELKQGNVINSFRETLNELSGYQLNEDVQPKVVMDNMIDFLNGTGHDLDERFDGLMATHLLKDDNLPDDKYKEITDSIEKRKFSGYTAQHRATLEEIRKKEATGAGHVGTEGKTKKGTAYKVVG